MRAEILLYIAVMALTTYLIRMLPTVLFRRKLTSRFFKRFFYYIPYAVLAAMTFPAVFSATGSPVTALAGVIVAILLAYFERSLIFVSIAATLTAFLAGLLF